MSRNESTMLIEFEAPPLPSPRDRWALFVDIDGTLVDFAQRPDDVRIDSGLITLLERLEDALDGALAVLSGRHLADIDRMLAPLVLPAGALHGIERRLPNGDTTVTPAPRAVSEQVRKACLEGIQLLRGVTLESKAGSGFAMHYRSARHHAAAVHQLVHRIADESGSQFVVQTGSCVAELIPPGRDKGSALRSLLDSPPFRGRRPIVLGDDLTDEHAFIEASRHEGFGIIVGGRRPTAARFALESPGHAVDWLHTLLGVLNDEGAHQ